MNGTLKWLWLPLIFWMIAAGAASQDAVELRFLCFEDGVECAVYADLLARFSLENPEIAVAVEVVPGEEIHTRLAAELAAGAPPDIARVADLGIMADQDLDLRPLLAAPDYLQASFPEFMFRFMSNFAQDTGLYGYPDAAAVVAPFVNTALFDQAGVAVPGDGASWEDWLLALDAVAAATDAPYALAVDNKDHRLVGPAMSLGAEYFDDSGHLTLADASGLRAFLQILDQLLEAGKTPRDTLLGTGKSQEYFVRGEAVMYICGSWKAEQVAEQVGAGFAWEIVANPAGPGGSAGFAQFTALVASADTRHPQAVAQVFDYLLQPALAREFAARALTVPANASIAASGIEYETEEPAVAAALNGFARSLPQLQLQAIQLDLHPLRSVYYESANANLRGYFAGELSLDAALANIQARLLEADSEP